MFQKRDTKKKAIANGALRLFASKGIEATTTKDISKASKAAEGTIYRHFKGKDDLALSLFIESANLFTQFLRRCLRAADEPHLKLRALIGAFFEFAQRHASSYSYVIFAHHSAFKKLPKEMPKPKDVFVDVILEGIKKGAFKEIDENLAASMVIGMCIRVNFFHENGLIKLQRERLAEEVAGASLMILRPKAKG